MSWDSFSFLSPSSSFRQKLAGWQGYVALVKAAFSFTATAKLINFFSGLIIIHCQLFMGYLFLFFWCCLVVRYPDVEVNPGPGRTVRNKLRILCSNIRGLYGNLGDLSVAASAYDIVLCSESLVTSRRHISELAIPHFNNPILELRRPRGGVLGLAAYVREGLACCRVRRFECKCCEFFCFEGVW